MAKGRKKKPLKITLEVPADLDLDHHTLAHLTAEQMRDLVAWAKKPHKKNDPPSWVMDPALWKEAETHVKPYWDEYTQPYAVVTHVYEKMGGRVA